MVTGSKLPTVMLVKIGTLADPDVLRKMKHHPELVAMQNLINSVRGINRFVFVGMSRAEAECFQKGEFIEYDLKTGSFLATASYIFSLIFLLFKFRPKRIIAFNDWIFPISLYCLLTRRTKYTPFFVAGFKYWGYKRSRQLLHNVIWKLNWTFLRLSRFKLKGVFALSHHTMNSIVQNVPQLRGIVRLISYPISSIYRPSRNKPGEVLLVTATIIPRKGLHTLIQAMPLINSSARLIIKGIVDDAQYFQYLQKLVSKLRLESRVSWNSDHLSDVELAKLYNKAKIFVFPTLEDALGVVVLEALSSGLPVIGTRNTGVADMVVDGKNGLLVPLDDPVRLAEAVNSVLNDSRLYRTLAENTINVLEDCYYRDRLTLERAMKFAVEK